MAAGLTYYTYPSQRDVVFLFGAGTSYASGGPLQSEIVPIILNDHKIGKSLIGSLVRDFIRDNFVADNKQEIYPSLEAVFGFLDYFIHNDESLKGEYSNSRIRSIREALVKLIYYIIGLKAHDPNPAYKSFWEIVKEHNTNISIITLNYDILLERALEPHCPPFFVDYCIHLMNYDHYEKLDPYNWWRNPRGPLPISKGTSPVAIKVLKAHGSLHWKYCNSCNQVYLTPWNTKIDLNSGKFLAGNRKDDENPPFGPLCPLDGSEFQTLILPPTYTRSSSQQIIAQVLSESAREIRAAKRVVFVGYALKDSDVHIKALMKKNLDENAHVTVIDPHLSPHLRCRFESLSKNIEFLPLSFEDLVIHRKRLIDILST